MNYEEWAAAMPVEFTGDPLLLTIIPSERGYRMKEELASYALTDDALLSTIPMP